MDDDNDLLTTIPEIARIWGYSESVTREHLKLGLVPGVWRTGRKWQALKSLIREGQRARATTAKSKLAA